MIVTDINGKERNVESIKKISHAATDSITGEAVEETFVEVKILGNTRNWVEWWPFADFKRLNPERRPRWKE